MMQSAPALEAFALTKTRRAANGESHIWRSPDIVLQPGEFVAVQSQDPVDLALLMGMLSGLLPVAGGVLRICGEAVEDLTRRQRAHSRARHIGMLFRDPKLLPDLDVLSNVVLPQRARPEASSQRVQERAKALLERLGVDHLQSERADSLTLLEGQLVSLARALVNSPCVLLADDPTAGLDLEDARHFLVPLRQLCQEEHVAVLLGTSGADVAQRADRVISLPHDPGLAPPAAEDVGASDFFFDVYEAEVAPFARPVVPLLNLVAKPLAYTAIVSLLIIFLTYFGLNMAGFGRYGGTVQNAFTRSLDQAAAYVSDLVRGDLGSYRGQTSTYYWERQAEKPVSEALRSTVGKSLVLLLLSMLLGAIVGVPLGLIAALARHRKFSLVFIAAAIIGVSTPSFFLALLLQILEISFYRKTGITLLPVGGFGWDNHIVLPALVLAARPIAQVARISFVALSEVLDADYIRTARAKGLNSRGIVFGHALQNAGVPILSALGASLQFSLSSLPVVESLFNWPGMGSLLLTAINQNELQLAAALALVLGILFVVVQVLLDWLYRWVDPRLRSQKTGLHVRRSWLDMVGTGWSGLRELPDRLSERIPWLRRGQRDALMTLPALNGSARRSMEDQKQRDIKIRRERRRAWVQSTAGSLSFVLGTVILLALVGMVVFGQQIAPHNPYSPTPRITVNGELRFAPFAPSATFPLGTDTYGRDILTQLLYGARRTLSVAFFAVLARIALGTILGALSGWFSDSLLDRVVMGLTQVTAAFPTLLMAMVLIYAFGIRQGIWVFALALSLVGWGEAAQFVRGQVMRIREQDYVEGALAVGLGDVQLLARHVLPNLVPSLVILGCLEMGGVLMLLGELGFIGVFIGGGWNTVVGQASVTVFDVPEWGVMLAGTWRSFRSQPWMTFYPALAFTLAIIGFNLFGEGLRRLTERLTLSMHRIINRYTVGATLALGALLLIAAEGTGSWAQLVPKAREFNAERAMADIEYLASPVLEGRGIGTPGLQAAAQYVAGQFQELGLQPGSSDEEGSLTYFADVRLEYRELAETPVLELRDSSDQILMPMAYRRDYAEAPVQANPANVERSEIVWLGMSPLAQAWPGNLDIGPGDLAGKVVLAATSDLAGIFYSVRLGAMLIVTPDEILQRRETASRLGSTGYGVDTPYMLISQQVADAILAPSGYSFEELNARQTKLRADEGFLIRTGVDATVRIQATPTKYSAPVYVQALIPGEDNTLDNEVVLLVAHYDGQGLDLDGTLYPGANRNASGVAVMLEIARLFKQTDFRPKRTVMFVAWAGGELGALVDLDDILKARVGFVENYRLSAVIELDSLGAGSEDALLLNRSQSGRLTEAFQQSARRSRVNATTRGRAPDPYASLYPSPDRRIPYIQITWDGSQTRTHTPEDTAENISLDKLGDAGRVVALATMYLAHEKEY